MGRRQFDYIHFQCLISRINFIDKRCSICGHKSSARAERDRGFGCETSRLDYFLVTSTRLIRKTFSRATSRFIYPFSFRFRLLWYSWYLALISESRSAGDIRVRMFDILSLNLFLTQFFRSIFFSLLHLIHVHRSLSSRAGLQCLSASYFISRTALTRDVIKPRQKLKKKLERKCSMTCKSKC